MSGKAAPAVSQGAGAFLIAIACCTIPVSGGVNAADLALRVAPKPQREAPAPVNGQRRSLFEEFLHWKRSLSR
jgi:hypothetical protein